MDCATKTIFVLTFRLTTMRKYIFVVLTIFVVMALTSSVAAADFDDTAIPGLNVTTDVDDALSESQSQNKTVALIFDQESCVYCDMLKEDVLSDNNVQKVLNDKFIVALVDINKEPELAAKYNVFGTPTTVFLDSDGNNVSSIEGYVESNEFLNAIKGI